MTQTLHIDYETASRIDLITEGVYNYATDLSTHLLCLGWAFGEEEPVLWWPDEPFPDRVENFFAAGIPRSIHCHNAAFERLIAGSDMQSNFISCRPRANLLLWIGSPRALHRLPNAPG